MCLDSIEIRYFKSIVKQRLDLGQVNVFIGANGSGKSNLLEAIGILSSALSGKIDYSSLSERGVRLSAPGMFKSSFHDLKRRQVFSLEAEMGGVYYQASIRPNATKHFEYATEKLVASGREASRSTRGQKLSFEGPREPPQKLDSSEGIVPVVMSLNSFDKHPIRNLLEYAIFSPSTPILRGISPDARSKEPLGLYGGNLAVALRDVVKDCRARRPHQLNELLRFLMWLESVGTTTRVPSKLKPANLHTASRVIEYTDKFMRTDFNKLYAHDVSEGALYILFVLVLLLHKSSPNIFALDNADQSLSPDMARKLMLHIIEVVTGSRDKQLFMITHNPTSLDSMDLFDNKQRLFAVSRGKSGYTEVQRVMPPEGFTREKWVEKYGGMRLSEIWLAGLMSGELSEF